MTIRGSPSAQRTTHAFREILALDQVSDFWSSNVKSLFELGLLVGQVSTSNVGDFVLAVVPVPPESESGDTPIGLSDVSVDWVQEVAQQVDHLLPGGITVLGLYVVSTGDLSAQIVPYLRAVAEALTLPSTVVVGDSVHYLAHVSPKGDFTFQSVHDVTDVNKTQILSAGLKSPATDIKFKQYRTLIGLDERTPFEYVAPNAAISAIEVAEKRVKEVENQLKPLFCRVADSIAITKLPSNTEIQHMDLLTLAPSKPQTFAKDPLGNIHGAISCIAFVSQSEPEANDVAAKYLKRDFVKSLLVRVSLARERWAEDDEVKPNAAFKEGGVIRLAQRGLVPWRSATMTSPHFSATVHVFPDEDAAQAVKNALEILGNKAANTDASWTAMEVGDLPASTIDLTFESAYYKHAYYVLAVAIVLIVLIVQYIAWG